ncbi:MAG: flavodoxin-dependent (E)-4-hydroxy-3-methylbut-2-enyl-diphosphate synthase [Spirochaetaceae bacterium]|nr:MAG: flavodoxin-dependent (E)-4-hydroxy-3-methylbut-2-enyl-diphosphate synthase [Spirochaetaceae bacterium]
MVDRRKTRSVSVGRIVVGGDAPISVQTMWKRPLSSARSLEQTLAQIHSLEEIGCEILRFSVPDLESAELLGRLTTQCTLPLVADIHFDHRLALRCLDFPVAKIRINPGNIGGEDKVEELVRKAADKGVPLRIGVNAGSLPKGLRQEKDVARAMVKAAEGEMSLLEKLNYRQMIFSLKAADVDTTVEANLLFSGSYEYPLHIGVTEAGPLVQGTVKNTLALSRLLENGVGDTIRISLSDSPENEIIAGRSILQNLGLRSFGPDLISCPTCGRTVFDVTGFLEKVQPYLRRIHKNITVAIMGCPVNGPGEAKRADLGVTGANDQVVFFKKGKIIRRESADHAIEAFKEELEKF